MLRDRATAASIQKRSMILVICRRHSQESSRIRPTRAAAAVLFARTHHLRSCSKENPERRIISE
jgi:hypothetical protein